MKKIFKALALGLACIVSVGFVACKKPNAGGTSENSSSSEVAQKPQLSAPENIMVDDEYTLTFDAVENATSYQISVDDGDYIDIGNVTEYDLSEHYGAQVSVRALGDETKYKNSREVYVTLDNYSQVFCDFEGAVGPDEWSGAAYGSSQQILGTTTEKARGGENSFKMFIQNNKHYGGILFDTGWYTMNNAIDWPNVKEISYDWYIDTLDLTQIEALCTEYGATYNAEVANVQEVYGADAGGGLVIFYANDEGEQLIYPEQYHNGKAFSVNKWYTETVDVSAYATITDFGIIAGNSQRAFGFSNEWSTPSPYCYLVYIDNVEVSYNTIELAQPENLAYESGTFVWDEVEFASGYEVCTDGSTWVRVSETEYSADVDEISQFAVRAVNHRKYADGTPRCKTSNVTFYVKEGVAEGDKTQLGATANIELTYDATNGYVLTWDAVSNAGGYAISFDKTTWLTADTNSLAIDVSAASETVYIKALSYGFNYSDGEIVSAKIYDAVALDIVKLDVRIPDLGEVTKVIFNNEECTMFTYENDVLTLTGVDKADLDKGKSYGLTVQTADKAYTYVAQGWNMVVSDATELQAMMDVFNANTETKNIFDYYCLDADIDATGVTSTVNNSIFLGILDGRGHTISNFTDSDSSGIVYALTKTGVIRNIAFVNANVTKYLFGHRMGGTIENVYVEMTLTPGDQSWYGVVGQIRHYNSSDMETLTMRNCVFNVTMAAEGNGAGGVAGAWWQGEGSVENVYMINNTNSQFISDSNGNQMDLSGFDTVNGYLAMRGFALDVFGFDVENGWSQYWQIKDGKLYFGNTFIADKPAATSKVELSGDYALDLTNTAETLRVADLDGELQEVLIAGNTVTASYADGVLTMDVSGLTVGAKYEITIMTSTTVYSLNATAWDRVISTNAEYKALIESNYDGKTNGKYCLDANIDATGIDSTNYVAGNVGIVFDGRGHVISNFTGRVFERMGADSVLRNIAFVDCTATGWFVARKCGGLIENVYIDVTITDPGRLGDMSQGGVIGYAEHASNVRGIKNCVINAHITPAANATDVAVVYMAAGKIDISNVYIVNQNSTQTNSITYADAWTGETTNVNAYTGESAFVSDTNVAFSTDNGWATYWKIENGELYFGETKLI